MSVIGVQRRMAELGRIRLGDKGDKGQPQKLTKFRLTSASRQLLEAAASLYGGTVTEWPGAPDEGYWQLYTEADRLDIILPPVFSDRDGSPSAPYSQFFELWSGGGCQRRCDGVTEMLSGKPCLCEAGERECKITTRLSVILPQVPGLGVWRLESHGWNAASVLPGTLDVLMMAAAEQQFIPAVLRLEQRSSKANGQTRRFVVPVVDLPTVTVGELVGNVGTINAPQQQALRGHREALPPAPEPVSTPFDNDTPAATPSFGEPPPLPDLDAESNEPLATDAQKDALNSLVGQLRRGQHITTEQLWNAMHRTWDGNDTKHGDDGRPHPRWSRLRDQLTKTEASHLIERIEVYKRNLPDPQQDPSPLFPIPESARQ